MFNRIWVHHLGPVSRAPYIFGLVPAESRLVRVLLQRGGCTSRVQRGAFYCEFGWKAGPGVTVVIVEYDNGLRDTVCFRPASVAACAQATTA
jgi:hypothetical protein